MDHTFTVLVCLLSVFIQVSLPCSPPMEPYEEPTLATLVHENYVEWVLYGRVVKHYPAEQWAESAYTAEMEVYCTYKGGVSPSIVNISEAGFIPGLCDAHNLEIGKSYYVLAYSGLRPTRVQEVTLDNSAMNELTSVCNLQMTYPLGVDAASPPVKCTAPADQSSCVQPSPDRGWGEESSEAPPEDSTTEDSAMPNLQEGTTLGSNAVDGGSGSASTWHFDSINICLSVLFVLLWN
ncbi:uncharacterized protein LOC106153524 [Lingula anatina]|uniref:Uncharacterized protein LOC106153524 n=1 Tax=Lingula anatina TaxID=7574 RepID=A0A1S3HCV6_LINAN|nr:uncharacterized protein LOC106153524 [Lingula anatina]|eukprot:XP_013382954.1 uncharacterized protein LOC106153524 [Lingula anatina]